MFKPLNHVTEQLYEVELVKPEIEHTEPIIVGFLVLKHAKQRMLALYYTFSKKLSDVDKYEELEMDTDSLYLALSEENLDEVILPEKQDEWNAMLSGVCTDTSTANATDTFFPLKCCNTNMIRLNTIRGTKVSLRKNLDVQKCCFYAVRGNLAMIEIVTRTS